MAARSVARAVSARTIARCTTARWKGGCRVRLGVADNAGWCLQNSDGTTAAESSGKLSWEFAASPPHHSGRPYSYGCSRWHSKA